LSMRGVKSAGTQTRVSRGRKGFRKPELEPTTGGKRRSLATSSIERVGRGAPPEKVIAYMLRGERTKTANWLCQKMRGKVGGKWSLTVVFLKNYSRALFRGNFRRVALFSGQENQRGKSEGGGGTMCPAYLAVSQKM